MASTNPARGMRDFLPADVRKREYVIGIIKEVYESYGFEPLETPAVENVETLMGKYGEEGNQLIFKILKRGEKLDESLAAGAKNDLADLALRYDLTVPLARVVANHKNDLPKFFKRYQIQPVWRADRPARGRFREFYQCDVDAIGSNSMAVEAELISAVSEILVRLGFSDFVIRLNDRAVLSGMLDAAGIPADRHIAVLTTIDKLDKIGADGVQAELTANGYNTDGTAKLLAFLVESAENAAKPQYNLQTLDHIASFLNDGDLNRATGQLRLSMIDNFLIGTDAYKHIRFDCSLARGLSYYTGTIIEINVPDLAGSLGGGGRYDGLIGMFGKEQIPACGFSLGLERILVVMEERGMFDELITAGKLDSVAADVLITIAPGEDLTLRTRESLKLARELRAQGLRITVYPEADKLGKQFKYADLIKVPFVCVLGDDEIMTGSVRLKNMTTGEEWLLKPIEVGQKIRG